MKSHIVNNHGNTSPGCILPIMGIMGIIGYLAYTSYIQDEASAGTLSAMYAVWAGWAWWAKSLSIIGPIVLAIVGKVIDGGQGFSKL